MRLIPVAALSVRPTPPAARRPPTRHSCCRPTARVPRRHPRNGAPRPSLPATTVGWTARGRSARATRHRQTPLGGSHARTPTAVRAEAAAHAPPNARSAAPRPVADGAPAEATVRRRPRWPRRRPARSPCRERACCVLDVSLSLSLPSRHPAISARDTYDTPDSPLVGQRSSRIPRRAPRILSPRSLLPPQPGAEGHPSRPAVARGSPRATGISSRRIEALARAATAVWGAGSDVVSQQIEQSRQQIFREDKSDRAAVV